MNHPSKGIGESHGKIILLGEHSVVYGEPSIAIPFLGTKVVATVVKTSEPTRIDCDFYHGLLDEMPELLESLKETIRVCLARLNQSKARLHLTIDSQIPAERGMGSSAAVSVATTRALFDFFKANLTQSELLEIVHISEKIAHGNPSGLDALMTSSYTPFYFVKGKEFEKLNMNLDGFLIVGDTGVTGQTKEAVESIALKVSDPSKKWAKEAITELGILANQGRFYLETNQGNKLGDTMSKVHGLLQKLEVSSPELDLLVETAMKNKALGAKLTGGGRGGCMIALAKTKKDAESISLALKNTGAKQTWVYEMRGS
ncbi:mevalonate kinase [Vagococcus fluvialis]|uniref:mevalonate kinase n=1 Tax=Vagococcus fluvialis TaxID=2738 RepID=UPI001D0BC3FE|nr:mevalonate kinase [Vagococcus fluvialis]MCM2139988.1 mevalonate kinase [Vagococcus fluvialis]MDT2780939.1 mevalonate kinase [Vagococcus fluvialis]UDM71979.1 mevalonate kinase [Vagococcus fluvialis]UDM75333.1 mevalonate kinase [Vagococcus fluvialis]UDM76843.1 mevalonate kinase [Vagococcus fluvialis]